MQCPAKISSSLKYAVNEPPDVIEIDSIVILFAKLSSVIFAASSSDSHQSFARSISFLAANFLIFASHFSALKYISFMAFLAFVIPDLLSLSTSKKISIFLSSQGICPSKLFIVLSYKSSPNISSSMIIGFLYSARISSSSGLCAFFSITSTRRKSRLLIIISGSSSGSFFRTFR